MQGRPATAFGCLAWAFSGLIAAFVFSGCSQSECNQLCAFEIKCRPVIFERSISRQVEGPADCRWVDEGAARTQCNQNCAGASAAISPVQMDRTSECASCLSSRKQTCDPEACESECLGNLGGQTLVPANIGDILDCVPDRIPSIPGGDTNSGGDAAMGGDPVGGD